MKKLFFIFFSKMKDIIFYSGVLIGIISLCQSKIPDIFTSFFEFLNSVVYSPVIFFARPLFGENLLSFPFLTGVFFTLALGIITSVDALLTLRFLSHSFNFNLYADRVYVLGYIFTLIGICGSFKVLIHFQTVSSFVTYAALAVITSIIGLCFREFILSLDKSTHSDGKSYGTLDLNLFDHLSKELSAILKNAISDISKNLHTLIIQSEKLTTIIKKSESDINLFHQKNNTFLDNYDTFIEHIIQIHSKLDDTSKNLLIISQNMTTFMNASGNLNPEQCKNYLDEFQNLSKTLSSLSTTTIYNIQELNQKVSLLSQVAHDEKDFTDHMKKIIEDFIHTLELAISRIS